MQKIPAMVRVSLPFADPAFTYDDPSYQEGSRITQLKALSHLPPWNSLFYILSIHSFLELLPLQVLCVLRYQDVVWKLLVEYCSVYISHRHIVTGYGGQGSLSTRNTKYEDDLYHIRKLPRRMSEAPSPNVSVQI